MNRKIKFRGKTTANGHWVYGNLIVRGEDHVSIQNSKSEPWIDPSTVGQFTGITDSNGKEIYEGDVVKVTQIRPKDVAPIDRGVRVVEFSPWYGWRLGTDKVRYIVEAKTSLGPIDRIEVIGNIHDNPELLKGGEDGRNR